MAVFGFPIPVANAPAAAVGAAVEMLAAAARYQRQAESPVPLTLRIGINTGLVVVGEVGSDLRVEYTAMGDAVNVAARMEQMAPPGHLRISPTTHALVRGLFDAERQAPMAIKGVDDPVVTYLVRGTRAGAARGATRGVEGLETRMVGREEELRALQQADARVRALHRLQRIDIVGDAGLGKSRLLHEFDAWASGRPERLVLLSARATPATQSRPYGLLHDLLASWLGLRDDDGADAARERFERVGAPPGDHELGALGVQRPGDRVAYAARRPRQQDARAVECRRHGAQA
jgi:hypothetical protein